jgi:hypothetical protein
MRISYPTKCQRELLFHNLTVYLDRPASFEVAEEYEEEMCVNNIV